MRQLSYSLIRMLIVVILMSINTVWCQAQNSDEKQAAILGRPLQISPKIEGPLALAPYKKPLSKVVLTKSIPGKIVFATTAVVKSESQSLIVIEEIKDGVKPIKKIYKVVANDYVYDPEFSPDGRYISFKVGYVWNDYGPHQIHIWDRVCCINGCGHESVVTFNL